MTDVKLGDYLQAIIDSSVWNTAPVSDQPEITLRNWTAYATDLGTIHLVGYNVTDYEGRTSTAVVNFDKETMRAVTASGRVYQLEGPPGYDSDGHWVWGTYQRVNKINSYTNVSDQFYDKGNNNDESAQTD